VKIPQQQIQKFQVSEFFITLAQKLQNVLTMFGRKQLFPSRNEIICLVVGAIFLQGCASTKMTEPARTATEQLLLSTAADRALRSANLMSLAGQRVFLDASYFDSYDSKYVIGTIRDIISRAGALLEDNPTNSDVTIEARSGALSTDSSDSLIGIPQMGLPIPLAGALQTPELAFYKSSTQNSTAKIALLAYATKSRKHIYSSGSLSGKAYNNVHKILFITWIRTDIPEKKKNAQKAEPYQTWFLQDDAENMPNLNARITNAVPAEASSANKPAH
jgi:hypothetical protein